MQRIAFLLSFFVSIWSLLGVFVGVLSYGQFGIAPRYLGWILAILVEVFAWQTVWADDVLTLIVFVNLPILAVVSFYFQMKHEELCSRMASDVFDLHFVTGIADNGFEKFADIWVKFSMGSCSSLGAFVTLFAPLNGDLDRGLFFGLTASSVVLLFLEISGGLKGKVWSKLKQASQTKIGLVFRPGAS